MLYSKIQSSLIKSCNDLNVWWADFSSLENLLIETRVDGEGESGPSSSSGMSSLGEYELIEMKEVTPRRWSTDGQLLQKSLQDQPLYQAYTEVRLVSYLYSHY